MSLMPLFGPFTILSFSLYKIFRVSDFPYFRIKFTKISIMLTKYPNMLKTTRVYFRALQYSQSIYNFFSFAELSIVGFGRASTFKGKFSFIIVKFIMRDLAHYL